MKKMKNNSTNIKIIILLSFLFFNGNNYSQTNCGSAAPFCTGTTYNFPAGVNNPAAPAGPNYSCLGSEPNPVWYYLQVANSGTIDITITNSNSVDVDFILWGPFTSPWGACLSGLNGASVVDCSYSTAATEYANIPSAVTGQYYMLLITNYSNAATNIVFSQTSGAGSTNCNILCNIASMTAVASSCNAVTNTFSVTGTLNTTAPPSSGTLTVQSNCGGNPIIFNPAFGTTTNYTLSGLTATGGPCQITASYSADPTCTFTVNIISPPPCSVVCTASANNTGPYCEGGNISLSASAGSFWSWTGPNGFSSANQNPTLPATLSASGIYTVTVISGTCTTTVNTTVIVNALPAPLINSTNPVCEGGTINFSAATGTGWLWSGPNSFNSTNQNPSIIPASINESGTYSVTITNSFGCSTSATTTVVVNPIPIITVNSPNNCSVTTNTLIASGAASWSWSTGATSSTITESPTSTTSYTVTGTDLNGCVNTAISTITINNLIIPLTISLNDTLCFGDTTTLIVSGADSYTWLPGGYVGSSMTALALSSTTYTVIGTNLAGCIGTDSVKIIVAPTLTLSLTLTNVLCNAACNGSAVASASPISGVFANYTYLWSNASTLPSVSNLCPGTYFVSVSDIAGCTKIDSIMITEPPALSATSVQTNILCNGANNGTATIFATGGSPNYSYTWPGNGTNASQNNLSPGTITVIITDSQACSTTVQITLTEPVLPLSISTTATNITCINATSTISSSASGGTPSYSYSWLPSGTGQNPTVAVAGIYTVTVTDTNNCVATQTVNVVVNTAPPTASAGVDDSLNCGFGANLNLVGSSSIGGATYSWAGPNGFGSTLQNPNITNTGSYTVTVTNPLNGCSNTDIVTIGQYGINASFTSNSNGGNYPLAVNFTNTSSNASNYIWTFGNGLGSNQTSDATNYLTPGTYTVILIASNVHNCIDTVSQIIIVLEPALFVIPNVFTPNGDGNNDLFSVYCEGISSLNVDLMNRWGEKVFSITTVTGTWNGKATGGGDCADGTYYYLLNAKGSDGKEYTKQGYLLLTR